MVTGIDEETGLNPAAAQALSQVRFLYHPPISSKNPARYGHRAETLQNHTAIDKGLFEAILQNPAGTGNKFGAGFCRFLQEQFYFSPQGDGVIRKGCPRQFMDGRSDISLLHLFRKQDRIQTRGRSITDTVRH
jgi:hypothetical protein